MKKNMVWIGLVILFAALFFRYSVKAEDAALLAWQRIAEGALVIDVRTAAEFEAGHLEGALNIEYDQTDALVRAVGSDNARSVVLYCRSGRRSGLALQALMQAGITNVVNGGGLTSLRSAKPATP